MIGFGIDRGRPWSGLFGPWLVVVVPVLTFVTVSVMLRRRPGRHQE